jgi:hydroxymethylpyrimidine pyrophosphatase-like HAD family hydrolase
MSSHISHSHDLSNIYLVATDMDGTLTTYGKFTSSLLQALENFAASGVQVLIVTRRSAAWVNGLNSLMPVAGTVAENGGLFYPSTRLELVALTPIPDLPNHRQHLEKMFEKLQLEFPQLR